MVAFWFSVYKLRSWKFCFSHSEHIAKLNTYLGDMPTMEEHQALQEQASTPTSLVPRSPPGMRLYSTPTGLVPRSPPRVSLYMYTITSPLRTEFRVPMVRYLCNLKLEWIVGSTIQPVYMNPSLVHIRAPSPYHYHYY